jgi:hypothetical protein
MLKIVFDTLEKKNILSLNFCVWGLYLTKCELMFWNDSNCVSLFQKEGFIVNQLII